LNVLNIRCQWKMEETMIKAYLIKLLTPNRSFCMNVKLSFCLYFNFSTPTLQGYPICRPLRISQLICVMDYQLESPSLSKKTIQLRLVAYFSKSKTHLECPSLYAKVCQQVCPSLSKKTIPANSKYF